MRIPLRCELEALRDGAPVEPDRVERVTDAAVREASDRALVDELLRRWPDARITLVDAHGHVVEP